MSPWLVRALRSAKSFPRVSGDEPFRFKNAISAAVFSPRERG